ncbi:nipped-b-like protein [Limosa lapponica baueri]|uniref:Nipped-b-like protein n=1 Tax=Limosa lapponica baueri TaxID=1758121 RepID=A0A2I0UC63_LIMLA|nr:nipped-b-like protein [Limosa lapponica baueri]
MPLSKGEEYSGPRDRRVDWQVFKVDVKAGVGWGDNIRPVLKAPEAIGIWETQIKHHKRRPPEEQHEGNGAIPASKSAPLGAQLKCLYTSACSMGNKQEELEAIVRHESYDVVAITETWWDESNDWSAAMESYKLLRRDRQGRRGGGVALYVREDYECGELTEGNGRVEWLWVQDPTLALIEPLLCPALQPVQVMLDGSQSSQFGIISELAEGTLCSLIQVIDKYVEQNWTKY